MANQAPSAYKSIKDVATLLALEPHVLRFWEQKFRYIKPLKNASGRRLYREEDIQLLQQLKYLLHEEGYTIKGVQKLIHEKGIAFVRDFDATQKKIEEQKNLQNAKKRQQLKTLRAQLVMLKEQLEA